MFLVLFIAFWFIVYFYFTRHFSHWKDKNVPFMKPIPFFGNAFSLFTNRESLGAVLSKIYRKTSGPFIGFFLGEKPILLVRDLNLIKKILIKDFHVFSDRSVGFNPKDRIGSSIMFLMRNPEWKELRHKISPVFTSGKLKLIYNLVLDVMQDFLETLEKSDGKDFDIREGAMLFTTDTITSTAFGLKANCFKDKKSEFWQTSQRIFNWKILTRVLSTKCYFVAPQLVKLFNLNFIDKQSSDFLSYALRRSIADRKLKQFKRNDLVDILMDLENLGEFNADQLAAQAVQFFAAGYETSSTTLAFALYELSLQSKIQNKLREEIISKEKSCDNKLTFQSLQDLEYLDMCFKEVLRKYPILPFLDRTCNANYEIPELRLTLEKGTIVYIPIWALHMDESFYPDPDKFDPERFTKENINSRHVCTYLPFGDGSRFCIGKMYATMTVKIALAQIISQFEVLPPEDTTGPLKLAKGFLLQPEKPIYLKFRKINHKI